MERIQMQKPGFRILAENALLWIVSARRPLKVDELLQALGIDEAELVFDDDSVPQVEDVISACAGLVTVDEESNVVRLVHYTTQEYFEQRQDTWLPDAEWRVAKACITFLSIWNKREWPGIDGNSSPAHKLFDYAANHWGHHLASAPTHYQLNSTVLDFMQSRQCFDYCGEVLAWGFVEQIQWFETVKFKQSGICAIHLAAHFGLLEAIKFFLDDGDGKYEDPANVYDIFSRTPIFYAIRSGKKPVVQELVSRGATVTHQTSERRRGRTPLETAALFGQANLVKFLICQGAEVDEVVDEDIGVEIGTVDVFHNSSFHRDHSTALLAAAWRGHSAVVEALLACGADVDFESKAGRTAIFRAAGKGHTDVVQLLINNGAHVESSDKMLTTPLMNACKGKHLGVVELLLRNGAAVDTHDVHGLTALRIAARSGSEAVVLALLEAGATMDARETWPDTLDRPLPTPLLLACEYGHAPVVMLLLVRGAHVEAHRKFIHRYARHREPKMTDLTPLLIAAYWGHTAVVAALLEYGADKEAANAEWQTPLMVAALEGRYDTVRLLLDSGADVHGVDTHGRNAATVLWNSYQSPKTQREEFGEWELYQAKWEGARVKKRAILEMFASRGAKLIRKELEDEFLKEYWSWLDNISITPSLFRTVESDLQVDMLDE